MGSFYSTLRARDPHNQSLAVVLCLIFALAKHNKVLARYQKFTFWNVSLCMMNFAFRLDYDRILFANSMGILSAYRTASADLAVHESLVKSSRVPRYIYYLGDILLHYAPAVILSYYMISRQKFVRPQHGWIAILGAVYFAFSQAGKLNVSGLFSSFIISYADIYVAHDWNSAWAGNLCAALFSPFFVNNAIKKHYFKAGFYLTLCFVPLILKYSGLLPWPTFKTDILEEEAIAKIVKNENIPTRLCGSCRTKLCANCQDFINSKELLTTDD